ncbi:hypothetical protein [Winogradskya humida]|nr:hypothetical protein [Actinoplanes humidus]
MIGVTGATGNLGRIVVDVLRERAGDVLAFGRAEADYDKPSTLAKAFHGVSRLLFISSPELNPDRRTAQHLAVVGAAAEAGVEAVVYTSFHRIAGIFAVHGVTEDAIAASGMAYSILRNPFYTEPFVAEDPTHTASWQPVGGPAHTASWQPVGGPAQTASWQPVGGPAQTASRQPVRGAAHTSDGQPAGELTHATGGQPLNTAYRADLAEAAARALLSDRIANRTYELTGPLWTFPELAVSRGTTAREGEVAGPMGWLHGLAKAGALATQTPDLEELLGRPARAPR